MQYRLDGQYISSMRVVWRLPTLYPKKARGKRLASIVLMTSQAIVN